VVASFALASIAAAHGRSSPVSKASASAACFGKPATILGTRGADRLRGTPGPDVIVAFGGDDVISSGAGADLVCAGGGDDVVSGGAAGDRIAGEAGDDALLGGGGNDRLLGGLGKDGCTGGSGRNTLDGCEGKAPRDAQKLLIDRAPTATADTVTVSEDAAATAVDVLANDVDPDGGEMRVVAFSQPGAGLVATGGTGLTYRPAHNFCGADSFTYTLNGGSTATVSVTVTCVDDPPEAVADSATTTEDGGAIAIPVLANDVDPDAGPESIVSKTDGAHGAVAITGAGAGLTYTPVANYCGTDSFTYTLNGGSTATVSVDVTCVDDPPVAVDDSANLIENDPATPLPVLNNDTDVDAGPRTIESTTQPAHGVVAITEGGSGLTYRPASEACSNSEPLDSFTYTLNGGSTATVTVTVECIVAMSSSQPLIPAFNLKIHDYAVRCTGSPLSVAAEVTQGYTVGIDGGQQQSGSAQAEVPLEAGQSFSFSALHGSEQLDYFVRCLPPDFPTWNYERLAQPSHEFYVVAPNLSGTTRYAVIFDEYGVPVWWYDASAQPVDVKVLPDGNIAWTLSTPKAEIRSLDGSLVRTIETTGVLTDIHEFQMLPNGNVILIAYPRRQHVDLTGFGAGADETVIDALIQEIDPAGDVVWSWNSKDHIGLGETSRWYGLGIKSDAWDLVHMNAVEPDGEDSLLISLRHTDAVYKIDKATGNVVWKLGGTPTPQSLEVLDDPQGSYPFGGQHDVRLQPDGTITVHDNNTGLSAAPRAVRYEIDEADGTARLLEEVTDPEVPSGASFCCGSARRSADGSWLMSWGGRSLVTEFNAAKERTFRLTFGGTVFSYRAVAVPDGLLSASQLRAGMNAMFPR
jgi:hypothetical protein